MGSNHIGVGETANNVQSQTRDRFDDSTGMMSEQQLIEEESSHIHSGEEDNEILQGCSSAVSQV